MMGFDLRRQERSNVSLPILFLDLPFDDGTNKTTFLFLTKLKKIGEKKKKRVKERKRLRDE